MTRSEFDGGLREDVAAAAIAVFSEHGYDRATVRQIAERAGLGTSTLYFHISSKEALFREIVGPVIESGTEWIEEMARSDLPPDEKFRLACIESVELYDRHPEIFIYLAEFVPSVEKAFPELMERSKRAWTELVESVLRLRQGPEPADVDLITYGILGMFSWMHRWYRPGGPRSAKEIGELYARVILEGIEPRA